MRLAILFCLVALAPAADALPCRLTAQDLASIAAAKGGYTKEGLERLPPEEQRNACRARLLLRDVRKGGGAKAFKIDALSSDDLPIRPMLYMTQQEFEEIRDVILRVMAKDWKVKSGLG